jgi:hypothetical protein
VSAPGDKDIAELDVAVDDPFGVRGVPLFDVTADGRRALAVTPARAESNSIGLLLNWSALATK